MAHAIYELEPIGKDGELEANGSIYWFCSDACLEMGKAALPEPMKVGTDTDYIPGTRCESCGNPLVSEDDGGRTRIGNTPETANDEKQDQDTLRFSLIEAIAEMYSTTFAAVSADIEAMPLAEQAFDEFCKAMEDAGY
jgi:hypothetical protein